MHTELCKGRNATRCTQHSEEPVYTARGAATPVPWPPPPPSHTSRSVQAQHRVALHSSQLEQRLCDAVPELMQPLERHLCCDDAPRVELELERRGGAHDLGERGSGEHDVRAPPHPRQVRVCGHVRAVRGLQHATARVRRGGEVARKRIAEAHSCNRARELARLARRTSTQAQAPRSERVRSNKRLARREGSGYA